MSADPLMRRLREQQRAEEAEGESDEDEELVIPDHTVTDERMRWHEEQARKLQSAEAQVVLRREAHAAFLAAEATATAAEARGAKEAHRLAQEDEQVDSDVVNAVADEADLASEAAYRAHAAAVAAKLAAEAPSAAAAKAAVPPAKTDGASVDEIVLRAKQAGNDLIGHAERASSASERVELLERAETCYGQALEADGAREHAATPVVLANRAHVRLRLAHTSGLWSAPSIYRAAICDCTEALSLSAGHAKALYRRARARLALASAPLAKAGSAEQAEMLSGALADFDALLAAEPSHREARRWREAAPRLSSAFGGKRLPDSLAELEREMARLDGGDGRPAAASMGDSLRPDAGGGDASHGARSSLLRLSVGVAVLAAVTALGVTCLEPGRAVSEIVAARGGAEGATAGMP